ncbi:2-hydroxyacid dehydrogenase [Advenella kashmirensis W13003]|uniref:2-hydroxyacid dehydrogenase n=1 Tax=Advenella kashmirensis W13003 TaxID=1424334 RepID=V8QS90_9BURK|nr:D-2-hydroxyacid dehydrogenase [Advenella kashmirensis]ETF02497.1 2-hydroxyacid dehydrogenase [Advenella kashmirensis W13003]
MATDVPNILISEKMLAHVRDTMRSRYGQDRIKFIPFTGQRLDERTLAAIDIAFVSRDITATSTKYVLEQRTETFYQMMEEAPRLQWVHVHSAGVDRPIYIRLRDKGLNVTSSTGAMGGIVAQSVLAAVLALNRRFRFLEQAQRDHAWRPLLNELTPPDLQGQHVLLAGWGAIGQTIARYLAMLGMRVTVLRNSAVATQDDVTMLAYDDMHQVLADTDWLILACPLTDRTHHLVNQTVIEAMKPGVQIVNVARGEVIEEAALIAALQSGHVAGAYLDVMEKEPLGAESPLWDMPNVIVSPHTAGHSAGNGLRVADMFMENLANWIDGKPLKNLAKGTSDR